MMDSEPDRSEAWLQGHYGSREMSTAMAADMEKLAALQGEPTPRIDVTPDPDGGWNVWVWE